METILITSKFLTLLSLPEDILISGFLNLSLSFNALPLDALACVTRCALFYLWSLSEQRSEPQFPQLLTQPRLWTETNAKHLVKTGRVGENASIKSYTSLIWWLACTCRPIPQIWRDQGDHHRDFCPVAMDSERMKASYLDFPSSRAHSGMIKLFGFQANLQCCQKTRSYSSSASADKV